MARTLTTDLETGVLESRVFFDGGVFGPVGSVRLDEIGTVLDDVSDRRYAIHPDDPLSPRASMTQTASFRREGWDAEIETASEMWADAEAFHFKASVTCRDGGEVFHHVDWETSVPRNGQ